MGPACLIPLSQQGQQPLLCTQAKPICRAGYMLRHGGWFLASRPLSCGHVGSTL